MMNLSQRDKILLAFLIIILLGAGFYFLSYAPINKEINTIIAANKEMQMEKERLQTEIDNTPPPSIDQNINDIIDGRLPDNDEMIPLLTMLDETLGKYNLPFKSFDYRGTDKAADNGVWGMTFIITTTGKLIPLLDFVNELEKAERLISIEDVSFNGVKAEPPQTISETEAGPPAYYIAPPGIPEGKLQRIKFEIVDAPDVIPTDTERLVAESYKRDYFDMRITIKAYYADLSKKVTDSNIDTNINESNSETEGAV